VRNSEFTWSEGFEEGSDYHRLEVLNKKAYLESCLARTTSIQRKGTSIGLRQRR